MQHHDAVAGLAHHLDLPAHVTLRSDLNPLARDRILEEEVKLFG